MKTEETSKLIRENRKLRRQVELLSAEKRGLERQVESLTMLVPIYLQDSGSGFVTQRKAKLLFGVSWLAEKDEAASKYGIRLWMRTGGCKNSPKKYSLKRLNEILEWERKFGLEYDFRNYKA